MDAAFSREREGGVCMGMYQEQQTGRGFGGWSRTRWLVVSAIVIAVIVVIALIVLYSGGGSGGGGGGGGY
jgi:hypothetical protein